MRTALVAIGRRENEYAREWVNHHLSIGFDHIYLYDNNHDGEERFDDVIGDFVTENSVTIINYRNIEKAQRAAYNDAYQKLSYKYDWLAFFDFDEFLCFSDEHDNGITALRNSNKPLQAFLRGISRGYHVVMIPWVMMTDSGLVRNDHRPCMERFVESTLNNSGQGKCIVRTGIAGLRFTKSVHVPYEPVLNCCTPKGEQTVQKRHQPQDTSIAYLKHFSTKTIEEWLTNKWQKGAAGINYDIFREKYQDYFFTINERTADKEAFIREWRNNRIK